MKTLQLSKPHLITIVGVPGAGKTFFAEQFSRTFSAPYLNFNDISAIVDDSKATQATWDYLLEKLALTKQTLLLEGSGATKAERQAISMYARSKGYQPLFIWVQTEPATAQQRATKNTPGQPKRKLLSNSEFQEYAGMFEPLNAVEPFMVISGKHTYASQAKNVLKKLTETRAESAIAQMPDRPSNDTMSVPKPRTGRIKIS